MYEIERLFDELQSRLDFLRGGLVDNEAMRHELIVRPILTHPLVLGWAGQELIAQKTIDALQGWSCGRQVARSSQVEASRHSNRTVRV